MIVVDGLTAQLRILSSYREAANRIPTWGPAVHDFMIEQMRRARIVERTGEMAKSLRNRSHPNHYWSQFGNEFKFGSRDPALRFGKRSYWGWGNGVLPPIDEQAYVKVLNKQLNAAVDHW